MKPASLAVSIVTYSPDLQNLESTISTLVQAVLFARKKGVLRTVQIFLVDNGPRVPVDPGISRIFSIFRQNLPDAEMEILSGHGNLGYGSGHNLAITHSKSDYHLVLNPDVDIVPDALSVAITWMESNPDVCLLSPFATDAHGHQQFLCKRFPALFDLLLRGFAPQWLRRPFSHRLEKYEMRELKNTDAGCDVPIVSGCFMLFRLEPLRRLGGFDKEFFLYFEDFDISLRIRRLCRVVYVPSVRIVHHGGQAAKKGWHHIRLFVASMIRFYRCHGWKLF